MVRPAVEASIQGFTLIELLVTIAIMVSLLLASVPLISDWMYSAQTRDAQAKLVQGFATAKALALRDPAQVSLPNAAAGDKRCHHDIAGLQRSADVFRLRSRWCHRVLENRLPRQREHHPVFRHAADAGAGQSGHTLVRHRLHA